MGHDLGHTPFGHAGETALAKVHPRGFRHNEQSLRVCDVLETSSTRRGMNLTEEVRDGILNHTGPNLPFTLEGRIVKIADRIAYVSHDTDDALRSGIILENDLPRSPIALLGGSTSSRINTLTRDMVESSDKANDIRQSEACRSAMNELREFLFDKVYMSETVAADAKRYEIEKAIPALYNYYMLNPVDIPYEFQELIPEYGLEEIVKDHVAGMTDRYARDIYVTFIV
jgi:dGTPase